MNPNPDPSRYKLDAKPGPYSYGKHAPTEMLEVYGHPWQRLYQCPVCKDGYEMDAESKAVGVSCAGGAMLESVEEPNE